MVRILSAQLSIMRATEVREPKRLKQATGYVQADVSPLSSVEPVKQRFCLAKVGNLNALRKRPIHRFKDLSCVGLPILPDPEPRKA